MATSKASKAAATMGRLGGRALVKKYGKEHMKKISKKATEARWGKDKLKNKKK